MPAIEIIDVVKEYGDVKALQGLTLTVDEGKVFGFCGPNGAGKSTTIKILVGLVYPTSGTAKVLGIDAVENGVEARAHIGYLPEQYGMPGWDTPRKFLKYIGILSGLSRDGLDEKIEKMAKEIGFTEYLDRRIKGLSKGNKQKVGIAQAFLHEPKVILFDEPTTGLDPIGRNEVLAAMKAYAKQGNTVLFSTHILTDVEKICDEVCILYKGKMIEDGTPGELRQKHGARDLDEVFLKVAQHE